MRRHVLSLVRQYLFWMFFFLLLRALFLVFHIPLLHAEHVSWREALAAFWHAIPLDTATACYLLLIPMLILVIQGIFEKPWLNQINKVYSFFLIGIFSVIAVSELGIYNEWKTKLNGKALTYLTHPEELYRSISGLQFFGFLLAVVLLTSLGIFLYNRVFYPKADLKFRKPLWAPVFLIFSAPLLLLGLRGGMGAIPITTSSAYFSNHSILNWASVNSVHNFAVSYLEGQKFSETNPFRFYPPEQAMKKVRDLQTVDQDSTTGILKTARPNIVILLMESWSADLVESLGGEPGITPEFRKLEQEGVLFTHLYASGNRSQQGLASIFSGFPAIPYTTITQYPEKYGKLPSLPRVLEEQGYATSFYFGGDLDYGNILAYVMHNGFDKIVQETDVDGDVPRGRLGIHDEFMMKLHAEELSGMPEPFFSVLFTLSSHSPYDQPKEHSIDWQGEEALYVNSAYYSDYSLGQYFEMVKKEPWYDSTLFVVIADHSHNTYRNWPVESFNYRRIPMLLLGGALKDEWRGRQVERLSSNGDLPATLLEQMDLRSDDFSWSRDLFNPFSPQYAYFEINDGVGWKTSDGEFIYNSRQDLYLYLAMHSDKSEEDKEMLLRQGKSYVQVVFQTFLDM